MPPGAEDAPTARAGASAEQLVAGMANVLGRQLARTQLLQIIVEAAAAVVGASGAALLLIDDERGDLWFEAALQTQGEDVRRFRVPLGHGIAGLVAVSGQPMAISSAQDDPQHASDIAESIGYAPDSIVCVPLHAGDEVIGVLECLDKHSGEHFGPRDIELLGQFARVAAAAIAFAAIGDRLSSLLGGEDGVDAPAPSRAERGAGRSLDLASRLHDVVARGDREHQLVEAIVEALAGYLEAAGGARDSA